MLYRGCVDDTKADACRPADVDSLPAEVYHVGILLHGTVCTCNGAFCNGARRVSAVDITGSVFAPITANQLITLLVTIRAGLST